MFEKFTSKDSNDFRQRYQGTFGYFIGKGKRTLTRLDNIVCDGRNSYVEFSDRDGVNYLLKPDSEDQGMGFEFIPPKAAYFNTKIGNPRLVKRIPARQYQRGICDRNTSIQDMKSLPFPVSFDSLIPLFEEKIGVREALQVALKSKHGARGVALSNQFAICFGNNVLRCLDQAIGFATYDVATETFQVELDSKELWQQELTDVFKRNGMKVVIK